MTERPDKLNNQAILLANGGEYYEAIAYFKRAITISSPLGKNTCLAPCKT